MEIKISHKPVPYKEAMDFLEKKVEKDNRNKSRWKIHLSWSWTKNCLFCH